MSKARVIFKSETQHYVICPFCKEIHIHHVDFGTQDRPANCIGNGEQTYTIEGMYTLREISQAINSRDHMVTKKRKARSEATATRKRQQCETGSQEN
jgi:hypothetical protein